MEIQQLIKDLLFGIAPITAGVYLFDKDSPINIFISILLLIFGCVIIGILVWNYIEREKAMRSSFGFGYLK